MRNKWLNLARRDPTAVCLNSPIYFCEDHFDVPNDMDNFMEYHVMGSVSQVRMKPGCIPTKFDCQSDRRKRTSNTTERPYILKKQRKALCIELEERSITTKPLELGEALSGSSVSHGNQENIKQEEHKTADKSIQVHMTHKFRSKAFQTENKLVNQMTSPLKPNLQSVSISPFKITRCSSTCNPSTSNSNNPSRKILAIEDQSDSDISYTPSIMHRESSPSTMSTQMKSNSDCSELMHDDKKLVASQILKCTLLKIDKNPRLYIGLVKNCFYLIGLIEENTNIPATHILMCLKKID